MLKDVRLEMLLSRYLDDFPAASMDGYRHRYFHHQFPAAMRESMVALSDD